MEQIPATIEACRPLLDKMWASACRVCDNIREFQPDLLLVLMHSGWGPVFAARVLWQLTQSSPFPPLACVNLGREKITNFEETISPEGDYSFPGEYASVFYIGKLLAWLTTRTDWAEQLRQKVAEAMQTTSDPGRILAVDDCIHEGSTSILTQGLLHWIYPQTGVRFLDTHSWYHRDYIDFMLALAGSRNELFPPAGEFPSDEIRIELSRVAIGSVDTPDNSLAWQPISLDSPAVQALSVYRPPSYWIQISQAIYPAIGDFIAGRAANYQPGTPESRYFIFGIQTSWWIMRDIWLEGGVSRGEVERHYGISRQAADRIFKDLMEYDDVVIAGRGRGTRYVIPDRLRRYTDGLEQPPEELYETYWLLPGRLLFGDRLIYSDQPYYQEWGRKEVRYLLDSGVDCWLDVDSIHLGETMKNNPLFLDEARARGQAVIAQSIPLVIEYIADDNYIRSKSGRPNRKDIRAILDQIDHYLTRGCVVYVSSYSELREKIAGCYLARHGQTGRSALATLQACRATVANNWRREPASNNARRFVRAWPEGL